MVDTTLRFPARPSLEPLRKQAKELPRDYRAGNTDAAQRFCTVGTRFADPDLDDVTLAEARSVIARVFLAGLPRLRKISIGVIAQSYTRRDGDLSWQRPCKLRVMTKRMLI